MPFARANKQFEVNCYWPKILKQIEAVLPPLRMVKWSFL